jgi:hypothetical protein
MMPSTIRLTAPSSPPAFDCKSELLAGGACWAIMFAAAKTAAVTIRTKRVAVRSMIFLQLVVWLQSDDP